MYKSIINDTKEGFTLTFSDTTPEALQNNVAEYMKSIGYQIKQETGNSVTYERGSFIVRVLLGAFYKYFKWEVKTYENNGEIRCALSRKVSGMWGGVIGINQNNKEIARIKTALQLI